MIVSLDAKRFEKDMKNLANYALGFLEGAERGKSKFLIGFGAAVIESLKLYIDANARVNPEMLHHIYEWNRVGSPESRLFELSYTANALGLSINSKFSQSRSVKQGSKEPFYNKASIMENGIPVIIRPRRSDVLAFNIGAEQIFTKSEITIENPGGSAVAGSFEKTFRSFFSKYFSQAFLTSSGIAKYLSRPEVFNKRLAAGKRGGRQAGISAGYGWISGAGAAE